ncbi:DNA repair protein RadA, partial [Thermoactinomyces vulgaris]
LDSVQTVIAPDTDGVPGGVTQVKAVASAITAEAKSRNMAVILVGHVTKDGGIAGPRALEHLVDTVVHFEGDRHSMLRLLRGVKNRFGPADEVGCFEMAEDGIISLADPSGLFLDDAPPEPTPGTCVTVTMEGRRAVPVEVQALLGKSVKDGAIPR